MISYGISTFTAGTTLSFLVLKFKKDEENLLERQDAEEEIEEDQSEDNEPQEAKTAQKGDDD